MPSVNSNILAGRVMQSPNGEFSLILAQITDCDGMSPPQASVTFDGRVYQRISDLEDAGWSLV